MQLFVAILFGISIDSKLPFSAYFTEMLVTFITYINAVCEEKSSFSLRPSSSLFT